MAYYRDLREHIAALEAAGKLRRITRRINKDTELYPLVRLQYRGLPENERIAFLFENVTDSRGRDYACFTEDVMAAEKAYAEAGITNPREQIDIAEVHDCFTITELIIMEDLGFSPRGKVIDDVNSGFFELDGGLPVNTDGGLKCFGHPIGASGLRMAYEVYKQLQGKAGPRQIKKADTGLVHNLGGFPGILSVAVAIFGKPE
jgi:acetyl-CoA acetyltransferase